jgi:hypothetical protein
MKKEFIILAVVIVALGAYLALRSTDKTEYELPRLDILENAKIDRMNLTNTDGEAIELVKEDEQWFIKPQGYLADSIKVKNMVSAAAGLTITALVSESENYQRYELDDDAKMIVELFNGSDKLRKFELGKVAPTFQHTFTKLEGNPNVYHAKGAMKNTFDQSIGNLRDKTVFTLKKDDVSAIEIKKGDIRIAAAKKEIQSEEKKDDKQEGADTSKPAAPKFEWEDEQGQKVEKSPVAQILATLSDLKCEDYLEDDAKANLKDPAWVIKVTDASATHTLSIYASPEQDDNEGVPATSSASAYAFELPSHKLDNLEKQMDALLGIEPEKEEK